MSFVMTSSSGQKTFRSSKNGLLIVFVGEGWEDRFVRDRVNVCKGLKSNFKELTDSGSQPGCYGTLGCLEKL